jgi:hypothetical protein
MLRGAHAREIGAVLRSGCGSFKHCELPGESGLLRGGAEPERHLIGIASTQRPYAHRADPYRGVGDQLSM